ncbi:uncharacterized protein LOC108742349 isoform X1 [Agrilus planipennis]|uniref:Uncharacterized protein LOC108742349 isoform X1 n=1 Tax=Agrilus planipennis TaxID=224129 RepID=A0A7F5REE4_AGRPL|nr:uncharacterized protein LOC108742349 isoform X1 [Agrilus planipennis]
MLSWDIVFWANKENVDYIPSCWAVDDDRTAYKWPQGVSQEIRLCLIGTCDPLNNVKYRISKGTAKRRDIKDLEKAKRLCEKAMYSSSVDTTDVDDVPDQINKNNNKNIATKPENKNHTNLSCGSPIGYVSIDKGKASTTPKSVGSHNTKKFNARISYSSDDEDNDVLLPLHRFASPTISSDVTAKNSNAFTPPRGSKRSIVNEDTTSNQSAKKAKHRTNSSSGSHYVDGIFELDQMRRISYDLSLLVIIIQSKYILIVE